MLIDGKAIAQTIYTDLTSRVSKLPFRPVFCDVLVGNHPASVQYVALKARIAERIGIQFLQADVSDTADEQELIDKILDISKHPGLCGLIVQLPLPKKFNVQNILRHIPFDIDVDCLNPDNVQKFYSGKFEQVPPTAGAVLTILGSVVSDLRDKTVAVVGKGELVGRPVAYLLARAGSEVVVVDSGTVKPMEITSQADIVVAGAGKPKLITKSWVKSGAIVIDAGTSEDSGSIVGDVDTESVIGVASYITATPGGVGPVTVAKLLENVVLVAESRVSGG